MCKYYHYGIETMNIVNVGQVFTSTQYDGSKSFHSYLYTTVLLWFFCFQALTLVPSVH